MWTSGRRHGRLSMIPVPLDEGPARPVELVDARDRDEVVSESDKSPVAG